MTVHIILWDFRKLAIYAINANRITLKEEASLNFTSNHLIAVFSSKYSASNYGINDIEIGRNLNESYQLKVCIIQYTSSRGNLDEKFKADDAINVTSKECISTVQWSMMQCHIVLGKIICLL